MLSLALNPGRRPAGARCAALLLVGLAGCFPAEFTGQNSDAVLEGPALGYGFEPVENLRKALEVELGRSNPAFEIDQVYATRASADADADSVTSIVFVLRNNGERAHCFVSSQPVVLYDADGNELERIEAAFINGSVAAVRSGLFSDLQTGTCLAIGERGFFGIYTASAYDDVARVALTLQSSSNDMISPPQAAIRPVDYSFSLNAGLVVEVENQGAAAATLESGSYLLLDEQDAPLGWGLFLDIEPGEAALQPGDTGTLGIAVLNFFGTAARVWVSVEFEDAR